MTTPAGHVERGEPRIPETRPGPWDVFRSRDFVLLCFGQLFGRLGTWMQFTALTYLLGVILARSQAESSLNLGLLGAAQMIPALSLGLIGGFVADRYPRRRSLILIASTRVVLAVGFMLVARYPGPWVVPFALLIAAGFAGADSFDPPVRQSWVAQIVSRKLYSNALGVLSIANNLPLMVGPALAGILIGTVGVYAAFSINAFAQCAIVIAATAMRPTPVSTTSREPMLRQIAAGVKYAASHPVMRWIIIATIVLCVCVRPYNQLLATFAGLVLHVDAKAYGLMLTIGGIGTIGGAIVTAIWRSERRGWLWFSTAVAAGLVLLFLGHVHNFPLVLVLLVVIALAQMTALSAFNVIMQLLSPEDMRGRTLSFFSMILGGGIPAGTLLMGTLGSITNLPFAYSVGGAIALVAIVWVWLTQPLVRAG